MKPAYATILALAFLAFATPAAAQVVVDAIVESLGSGHTAAVDIPPPPDAPKGPLPGVMRLPD